MTRRRWFLPEVPDVLGLLRDAGGDHRRGHGGARRVGARRRGGGRPACACSSTRPTTASASCATRCTRLFSPPLEPEDLFELSRGSTRCSTARRTPSARPRLMRTAPDAAIAEMAAELLDGHAPSGRAFAAPRPTTATRRGDRRRRPRGQEPAQPRARLPPGDVRADRGRRPARGRRRRELYRRLARTGDDLVGVAERVWYSVLKQT